MIISLSKELYLTYPFRQKLNASFSSCLPLL